MCGGLFISFFVFFKQKTAYEMRISDWSSDVCSSDLLGELLHVVVDGVAVVVVGNQVDRLHFFAVCLGQHGCNCLGCCVSVVAKTEAVAAAILAGGIARTADNWKVQGFCTLARVLQRDGNRADRKSVGEGKSVSVRVDLGGPRTIKKKKTIII